MKLSDLRSETDAAVRSIHMTETANQDDMVEATPETQEASDVLKPVTDDVIKPVTETPASDVTVAKAATVVEGAADTQDGDKIMREPF